MEPVSLTIKKLMDGNEAVVHTFNLVISLRDANGEPLKDSYPYAGDTTGTIRHGGILSIKSGQSVTITGLPAGTQFSVDEPQLPEGYSLVSILPRTGTIPQGQTATVNVTNKYQSGGSFHLTVAKALKDATLKPHEFQFALSTTKGGQAIETAWNDANGLVSFSPIEFDANTMQIGQPTYWYIQEVVADDSETEYDTHVVCYKVVLRDTGSGKIMFDITTVDPDSHVTITNEAPIFTNQKTPGKLAIKKVATGDPELSPEEAAKQFHYTLSLFDDTGQPVNIQLNDQMMTIPEFESYIQNEGLMIHEESTQSPMISGESVAPDTEGVVGQTMATLGGALPTGQDSDAANAPEDATPVNFDDDAPEDNQPSEAMDATRPYRIIVPTNEVDAVSSGMDMGNVSSVGDYSLVGFVTEESYAEAKDSLADSNVPVSDETAFSVADDAAINQANIAMTPSENPFKEAKAIVETHPSLPNDAPLVAVLDTGVPEGQRGYTVLGDDPADANGHATLMMEDMLAMAGDDDLNLVFIKVLDDGGHGTTSSVLAGLELAQELGARLVNMSMSAYAPDGILAIEESIRSMADQGILVVGAAGNGSMDAGNTVPGRVEAAVILGACDDTGNLTEQSNYGKTVDALATAESTSHAAAKASGWIASCDFDSYSLTALDGKVFFQPYETDGDGAPHGSGDGTFIAADAWTHPKIQIQTHISNIAGWCDWQDTTDSLPTYNRNDTSPNSATNRLIYANNTNQRLQNIKVQYVQNSGPTGDVSYATHAEYVGWELAAGGYGSPTDTSLFKWVSGGAQSPTVIGNGRDLEAVCIKLTGNAANYYDIHYKVRTSPSYESGASTAPEVPNQTFTAVNGAICGTTKRHTGLDALWVWLTPKTTTFTLDPNGGKFAAYTEYGNNIAANRTTAYTMANNLIYGSSTHNVLGPTVSRVGYTFNGWYTASSGGTKLWDSSKVCVITLQSLPWTDHLGPARISELARSFSPTLRPHPIMLP